MTYQDKPYPPSMADFIVTVNNGVVVGHIKVPWINEERADIAMLMAMNNGKLRAVGIKVVGTSSPWGGYHAIEQWAAQFSDIVELHMIHANIQKYGVL